MCIVILTTEDDISTNTVIEWLLHWNVKFVRINDSITIAECAIGDTNAGILKVGESEFNLNEIRSFWHRQNNFKIDRPLMQLELSLPFWSLLDKHIKSEYLKLNHFIHYELLKKKKIGNFFANDPNKLIVLKKAQDKGLQIPDTLITENKEILSQFFKKHNGVICKAISEAILFSDNEVGNIYNYTSVLTEDVIEQLPDSFAVTLFQEKIEKKYELRIFYLHDEFYPMAIFSQAESQTSVDFRNYNYNKPNRTVPYKLPNKICTKLSNLMKELQMDTGSIDMAVTLQDEFIFFEVNPVGQFGMTSYPCNYYIEKKIAEFLSYD